MKLLFEQKKTAIDLRKQGFSYSEIQKIVPVAKATLSGWFKDLPLTPEESSHLARTAKTKIEEGRNKAITMARKNRLVKEEQAQIVAEKLFELHRHTPDFLIGLSLFWAEGSHFSPTLEFTNSDPEMVRFMHVWFRKYLLVRENELHFRLHIQDVYKDAALEQFWAGHLKVSVADIKTTVFPPRSFPAPLMTSYKGCMKIYANRIEYVRIILIWEKMMKKSYSLK